MGHLPLARTYAMPVREKIQAPAAGASIQRRRGTGPLSSLAISARKALRLLISEPWCAASSCVHSLGLGRRAANSCIPLLTAVKSAYSSWSFAVRSIMLTQIEKGPKRRVGPERKSRFDGPLTPAYTADGMNAI